MQESVDLDDLLPQVGEFGKYQKLMLWLVCLPACFPCGFCAFNQLFMAEVPPHWCQVPELANFSRDLRKSLSIPKHNGSYSTCQRYAVNWSEVLQSTEDLFANTSWPVERCLDGYEFDTTEIVSSIVIDVNYYSETKSFDYMLYCSLSWCVRKIFIQL